MWRFVSSGDWQSLRRARKAYRHALRLYRAQSDLVPPEGQTELKACLHTLKSKLSDPSKREGIQGALDQLALASDRWLVDTSRDRVREITEMIVIAIVVVAAIRAFFVQTARIPTGSMQPTLNGIRVINLARDTKWKFPSNWWQAVTEMILHGRTYYRVVALDSGRITKIEPPEPIAPLLR
ncbi:MAG: S26 family signal peptidase, partial [Verrucomicrobiae bacterium]|nr:S26 family signal peptidase [Verrucomicrobiae bacterium]